MAGVKHERDDSGDNTEPKATLGPVDGKESILTMFTDYRTELDEHHDRRERIVKASRDVTALSKKMVRQTPPHPLAPPFVKENDPRLSQITDLLLSVAPDLQGPNAWRYQRQISPGLQEYIEAISFSHYLTTQTLLTYSEAQVSIPGGILLTEEDYLLGLFDLTGEMMRFAINTIATGDRSQPIGHGERKRDVLSDLREIRVGFEGLDVSNSGYLKGQVDSKMGVMQVSVQKVESAVYGMILRGRERPAGWVPDTTERSVEVESH